MFIVIMKSLSVSYQRIKDTKPYLNMSSTFKTKSNKVSVKLIDNNDPFLACVCKTCLCEMPLPIGAILKRI